MQEFDRKEKLAGKRMGFIFMSLGIFFILLALTYISVGYIPFFNRTNYEGEICDGLGRMLDSVPPALSIILPQWAGHIWFIIDCLVLLGMVVIIDRLFVKSKVYFTGVKNVDF